MKSHTNIQIETRFTSKYFSAWWKEFSRKFRNLKSKFEEWPFSRNKIIFPENDYYFETGYDKQCSVF